RSFFNSVMLRIPRVQVRGIICPYQSSRRPGSCALQVRWAPERRGSGDEEKASVSFPGSKRPGPRPLHAKSAGSRGARRGRRGGRCSLKKTFHAEGAEITRRDAEKYLASLRVISASSARKP